MARTTTKEPTLGDDLLFGARAIARELGVTERIVYYLTEKKAIPVFYTGGKLTARRSQLDGALRARPTNGEG
jgi:hypothetical protein